MNRILLFIIMLLHGSLLHAQSLNITTNINGDKQSYVIEEIFFVTETGKLFAVRSDDTIDREIYSDFNSYEALKLKRVGNTTLSYYSDFNSYESGKVKTIGDIKLAYYSNFNSYESGKMKSIGDKKITYYSNFNNYEAGKIKSIGDVKITYYSDFNSYEAGKIKSIGTQRFRYATDGTLTSGKLKFTQSDINFTLTSFGL